MKLLRKNLLYLALLSFVFVSSTSLVINSSYETEPTNIKSLFSKKDYPEIPVLSVDTVSFPTLSAQSVFAKDINSGKTLFEKDPDTKLFPASTTKILTALTALDYYLPNEVVKVKRVGIEGQKMGLILGEEIKAEDLMYGALIYSANDAAEVLADNFCAPGKVVVEVWKCGREEFIKAMNKKAQELNLTNSYFTNPTGLDNGKHLSTAKDLVRISEYAMKNPYFSKIVATEEYLAQSVGGKIKHKLVNINELVGEVDGVLGVKTGWTENARENLVTYIERDGHKVMITVLGSQDRFGETKELINWIFDNYSWEEVKFP